MNKIVIVILLVVLAGGGTYLVAQQNQKAAQLKETQLKEEAEAKQKALALEAKRVAAEQAKQKALEAAQKIEAEARRAKQLAMEEAKRAEEAAKQKAAELQSKVSGLITQAKSLLDGGKFQEAVDMAKSVLSQDPNNAEAKSILETAMAKIAQAAKGKATSLIKEDPKKALEAVTSGINLPQ